MAEEAEGGTFWIRNLAKGVSTLGALRKSIICAVLDMNDLFESN